MKKSEFLSKVSELEKNASQTTREERIEQIEKITDEYVESFGKRPDTDVLVRLADVILHEELTEKHVDKMSRNEYPIMSERQLGRRQTGSERHRSKRTGTVIKEVPLKHASNVATDGINYTLPIRNFRNPF